MPSVASPQWRDTASPALAELAASRGRISSRAELVRLQARVLAADAGLPSPDFVFPYRAGDLDGDGANDALAFEWRGDSPRLVALRGTDGATLWAKAGAPFATAVDLDDDGEAEVLAVSYEWTPVADGPRALVQRVSLLDGSDGAARWTTTLGGADLRSWSDLGGVGSDVQFVASLRVMPDATGDGRPDVWVGTMNGAFIDSSTLVTDSDLFVGRTLEGSTGLEVGRVAAAGVDALPWAVPAGDVSGDGLADVFTMSGRSWDTGALAAVSVAGTPWWARRIPSGQVYSSVGDLTGDGSPDIALQTFHDGGPSRIAYDGRTGAELWSRPDVGYIDLAGDIDGDGGTDLIQVNTPEGGSVLTAWSGATGETIWGPVHYVASEGAWVMFCVCVHDVTGDGIWDPLVADVVFTEEGADVLVRMLNGRGGLPLWTHQLAPGDGLPVPIGADADGDGTEDAGLTTADGISIRRGTDFTPLWEAPREPGKMVLGFYGDDLTGDGSAEIVAARLELVEEWFQGSAAAYRPGTLIWSAP
ncbi:MAG TPA: hypothetical protein VM840_01360 [Actinomycetota bacterium]|nr:hypothetical protein [Actinomycetota bacterium]